MQNEQHEYAGFWAGTGACIVDGILFTLVSVPLLMLIYGTGYFSSDELILGPADLAFNFYLPAILTVLLWRRLQATPGKMALNLRVLDAVSGNTACVRQCMGRYVGYVVSSLPLGLGFFWAAFERRKQGWHDMLAGTVLVRELRSQPVKFRS
ncbi:RDD family protein [Pseudomonas aeruginosa]|uniref:RDD family protein n=1 Tax=Pseudomonas aeruginosa TaxID=287 RepID=UPI001E28FE09|nr:RDD family protein [Pseudomonas aeruginosa]MCC9289333.1 RDD family protein [Pseudomonas aeruginosa]UVN18791.1 Hypothetical protein [Pseudomonas aeruginosa]